MGSPPGLVQQCNWGGGCSHFLKREAARWQQFLFEQPSVGEGETPSPKPVRKIFALLDFEPTAMERTVLHLW